MCNRIYIEAARAALARSARTRGAAPSYDEDAVADLLTDIRHFCAAAGHDFEQCNLVAAMHFDAESGGAS